VQQCLITGTTLLYLLKLINVSLKNRAIICQIEVNQCVYFYLPLSNLQLKKKSTHIYIYIYTCSHLLFRIV
jgi:hypothetical protein